MHHGKKVQEYRERVVGLSQEELGQRIGRSRRTIVTLEQCAYIKDIRLRRTLVWALQIPPQCLDLPEDTIIDLPIYTPHNDPLDSKQRIFDVPLGELFTDNLRMRLNLYYLGSTLEAEKHLDTHIKQLHGIERQCASSEEHRFFLKLLSHNYQVKGMIARDQLNFAVARTCFRQASLLAQRGACVELNALALGRLAGMYSIQNRVSGEVQKAPGEVVKLYEVAREMVRKSPPVLQAYLALGHAEVQGMMDDHDCLRSLDEARRTIQRIDHEDDDLLLFHSTRCSNYAIHDCWAQCHILIGKPGVAIDYYDQVEGQIDHNMTRMRARLAIQYAEALYANNDLSCCFHLIEGWKLAHATHSLHNIARANVLATTMKKKYPQDARVKDLFEIMQEQDSAGYSL